MKRVLFGIMMISLFFIALSTVNRDSNADVSADNIKWVKKYDDSLKKAQQENKNIFVLITAPSWCYYCKVFEKKVLKKENIQNVINESYVPLLVLDRVDGGRNPDLSKFVFPGFPSVYLYDKNGNKVKNISTSDAKKMLDVLNKFAVVANNEVEIYENTREKDNVNNGDVTDTSQKSIDDFMNKWLGK